MLEIKITKHTWKRVIQRFGVEERRQTRRVFNEAITGGMVSKDGNNLLVEHGCLLLAGKHNGNGTFTVQTVYNLSEGISDELKGRLANPSPSPWGESEVILPEEQSCPIVHYGTTLPHLAKGYGAVKGPA